MKILVGAWPGYGHLLPMVPLIRAAERGGHEVVVTSGSDMAGLVENLGVTAHASRADAAALSASARISVTFHRTT